MKNNLFLQTVDGILIDSSNIVVLQPNADKSRFRAQLRKPFQSMRYTPERAKQFFVWFEATELRQKGVFV
jgi:hypothetical protein